MCLSKSSVSSHFLFSCTAFLFCLFICNQANEAEESNMEATACWMHIKWKLRYMECVQCTLLRVDIRLCVLSIILPLCQGKQSYINYNVVELISSHRAEMLFNKCNSQPFLRASKSGDRRIFCSSGTSSDGFWSPRVVDGPKIHFTGPRCAFFNASGQRYITCLAPNLGKECFTLSCAEAPDRLFLY